MRTIEEIEKKKEGLEFDLKRLEELKEGAIDAKQYSVASTCKTQISIRKRDIFILNWILEI